MDRDPKFEIQYLISVIIAVLGSLNADGINQYVPNPTAYLLLLAILIHIVVFNIVYTLRRATEFNLSEVNTLERGNRWTLYGITGLFFYLLIAVVSQWVLIEMVAVDPMDPIPVLNMMTYGTLFSYIAPAIVALIMGGIGWYRIIPSVRVARDIEISVVPDQIDVFHDFEDTRPLHVNIENQSPEEIEFLTIIRFPDEVEWRYRETSTGSGTFTDETSVPASGGHEPYNIELRYQGQDRKTEKVDIIIAKGEDTYTDSVLLGLEEY